MGPRPKPRGGSGGCWFLWLVLVWSWLVWLWFGYGWFWLVMVWRVVSLVIGFAGWILAGRSLNADQDDVECRYKSGPDRSIELTSISGWAGKKPSQEGLVFGSVARLPLVGPEHQWVGRQKPKAISNTHTERRIPEQSTQVVSSSISGSLTIGNESPFQAHSVLESSSDFRLILRLENAP